MAQPPRVFISHAAKDKKLVDDFFDLLQTGVGISPNETFCTSLEGMGIPAGANFVDYIKQKIQSPNLILLVLTPNYLDSMFCLCELGAGWALSHNVIPIVVPPLTYGDLKAVLTGIHAFRIEDKSGLSEMRDRIIEILSLDAPPVPRWEVKRDKFLESLPETLKTLAVPDNVPRNEYDDVVKKYDEAKAEFARYETEIEKLKEMNSRLEACKNREEVLAVKKDMSDEWAWFKGLCDSAKAALSSLPSVVEDVIFHDMSGSLFVPDKWNNGWDEIREAADKDFLSINADDAVRLNQSDPAVERAISALSEVQKFLAGALDTDGVSDDFVEQYREKYDHNPNFNSKRLWETWLFS